MKKPSAATVIATLALFVALGGTSYAAVALAPNSVGSAQIKPGGVQASDIKDGAVDGDAIKSGSISVADLSKGAMNGLDGKDGAPGPAGPRGATGPAGPAGPAGAGGLALADANGRVLTGLNQVVRPTWVVGGTTQLVTTGLWFASNHLQSPEGIVLTENGVSWVVNSDGTYEPAGYRVEGNMWFRTADCTGPLYLGPTAPDLIHVTKVGKNDGSGPYDFYRRSATLANLPAGGSWYTYYSYANSDGRCGLSGGPPGGYPFNGTYTDDPPLNGVGVYELTTDVPATPAAFTMPFKTVTG